MAVEKETDFFLPALDPVAVAEEDVEASLVSDEQEEDVFERFFIADGEKHGAGQLDAIVGELMLVMFGDAAAAVVLRVMVSSADASCSTTIVVALRRVVVLPRSTPCVLDVVVAVVLVAQASGRQLVMSCSLSAQQ